MKYPAFVVFGLLAIIGVASCRLTPKRTAFTQIMAWIADSTRERFALSEIQDLPPWTAVYLFGPYTPESAIRKTLGFEWSGAGIFKLHERDDIHLAVFVTATNLIRVEEWSRVRLDCAPDLTGITLAPDRVIQIVRSTKVPTLELAETSL